MTFPNATLTPEPFRIEIPEEKIAQMKELIKLAPLPRASYETKREDRSLGITGSFMQKAIPYWRDEYDWKKSEARMNQYPHYKADVQDSQGDKYSVHFVAVTSKQKDAIPLLLLHGWPGSFAEFLDILPYLTASTSPAFHIIVPSLPGFGFTSPHPTDRDVAPMSTASSLFNNLMLGLGFNSYCAQGGDLGSLIARHLAENYPDSCKAYHLNAVFTGPPKGFNPAELNEKDAKLLARGKEWRETGNSYGDTHAFRTSTITHVLASSPVALFAWIGEKQLEWTDKDPSLNWMCEGVSLYWLTQTIGTTLAFYRSFKTEGGGNFGHTGEVPFGYSLFPKEIFPAPRSWAEGIGKLEWFKEHSEGGHFAATEHPEALAKDLIECFGQIYKP